MRTSLLSVVLVGLLVAIPLSLAGQALVSASIRTTRLDSAINARLPDEPGWSVLSRDLDDGVLTLTVVGPSEPPSVTDLDTAVEDATSVDTAVVLNFIQSEAITTG